MHKIWDADIDGIHKIILAYAHDRGSVGFDLVRRDLASSFKWIDLVRAMNDLRSMGMLKVSNKTISVAWETVQQNKEKKAEPLNLKQKVALFDDRFSSVMRTNRRKFPNDFAVMRRVAKYIKDEVFYEAVDAFFENGGGTMQDFLHFAEALSRRQ